MVLEVNRRQFIRTAAGSAVTLASLPLDLTAETKQKVLDGAVKRELGNNASKYIQRFVYDPDFGLAISAMKQLEDRFGKMPQEYWNVLGTSEAVTLGNGFGNNERVTAYFNDQTFSPKRVIIPGGPPFQMDLRESLELTVSHENNHGKLFCEGYLGINSSNWQSLNPHVFLYITESAACIEDIKNLSFPGKSFEAYIATRSAHRGHLDEWGKRIDTSKLDAFSMAKFEEQRKINQRSFQMYTRKS